MSKLKMKKTHNRVYHISFETRDAPGTIKAVRVELGTDIVRDMKSEFRVDLSDDPLYPALCRYVAANPPKEK
jgi:hypothetical protein